MLASVPLFRAIKETYPKSRLSVLTSNDNYFAIEKNKYVDEQFNFDKSKLHKIDYFGSLIKFLKNNYDVVIIPTTVSISFTSHFLGRIAKAKTESLNDEINQFSYLCDRRISLDWRTNPDQNVSQFILELVKPFGIYTDNYQSEITFDENDKKKAEIFFNDELKTSENQKVIGMHVGAGKPPNRWDLNKFIILAEKLHEKYNANIFFTGSNSDKEQLNYISSKLKIEKNFALNKKIPELAAIIAKSDLFITNDTGVMHVAGAVKVNQISLFGPTKPENWAPIGTDKLYVRKSDDINDIDVEDVYDAAVKFLGD
jgi:ADP-heptose:LPS heptosyltransferase